MKKLGLGTAFLVLVLVLFMPANPNVWLAGFLAGSTLVGLMLKADSAFFNKRLAEEHRVMMELQRVLFKLLGRR